MNAKIFVVLCIVTLIFSQGQSSSPTGSPSRSPTVSPTLSPSPTSSVTPSPTTSPVASQSPMPVIPGCAALPCDANADGTIDLSDMVAATSLFSGKPISDCGMRSLAACASDYTQADVADIIAVKNSLYPRVISYPCPVLYGDIDGDGILKEKDAIIILEYLFQSGPWFDSSCDKGDADRDGYLSISDAISILNYINNPAPSPTSSPITTPVVSPTIVPTYSPVVSPTRTPSVQPSTSPSMSPTVRPSASPVLSPASSPTVSPSTTPRVSPSVHPTGTPGVSPVPCAYPSPCASPSCKSGVACDTSQDGAIDIADLSEAGKLFSGGMASCQVKALSRCAPDYAVADIADIMAISGLLYPDPSPFACPSKYGDIDNSGVVDARDASLILGYLFDNGQWFSDKSCDKGDYNRDNTLSISDPIAIFRSLNPTPATMPIAHPTSQTTPITTPLKTPVMQPTARPTAVVIGGCTLVPCDANADRQFNIADIPSSMNILLNKPLSECGLLSMAKCAPDYANADIADIITAYNTLFPNVQSYRCPAAYGDINGDSKVDESDAVIILNYLSNGGSWFSDSSCDKGDFNRDGSVNIADSIAILNYLKDKKMPVAVTPSPKRCTDIPCDVNSDGNLDIADISVAANLFNGKGLDSCEDKNMGSCGPDPESTDLADLIAVAKKTQKFPSSFACPEIYGDINSDSKIDAVDSVIILDYLFNKGSWFSEKCCMKGDFNHDGMTNIGDAIAILTTPGITAADKRKAESLGTKVTSLSDGEKQKLMMLPEAMQEKLAQMENAEIRQYLGSLRIVDAKEARKISDTEKENARLELQSAIKASQEAATRYVSSMQEMNSALDKCSGQEECPAGTIAVKAYLDAWLDRVSAHYRKVIASVRMNKDLSLDNSMNIVEKLSSGLETISSIKKELDLAGSKDQVLAVYGKVLEVSRTTGKFAMMNQKLIVLSKLEAEIRDNIEAERGMRCTIAEGTDIGAQVKAFSKLNSEAMVYSDNAHEAISNEEFTRAGKEIEGAIAKLKEANAEKLRTQFKPCEVVETSFAVVDIDPVDISC